MALTDNLIAYYKFNEASGNPADSVGTFSATASNITYGNVGKIDNCFTFNGSNSTVNVGTWTYGSTFSISAWVKLSALPASNARMSIQGRGDNGTGCPNYGVWNNAGTYRIYLDKSQVLTVGTSNGITLDTTTFHMYTVTYNGSVVNFYFDGVNVGSTTNAVTITNNKFNIGNDYNIQFMNGWVDELGIWQRVLYSTEITTLNNSGNGLTYPFTATNTGAGFLMMM